VKECRVPRGGLAAQASPANPLACAIVTSACMLRILDRYTIREILPPFALALLVFTFLLIMGPIDRTAQQLLASGASAPVVLKMLVLLLPMALGTTIPMAFLFGMLVAFGRLSGDSEWVALQACGVSLQRMLRPVMVLAVLSWAASQWVLLDAVPRSSQALRDIEYGVVAARIESEIKPRIFFRDFPNLVLYARDTPLGSHGWTDVFVADTSKGKVPQVSVARRGRILLDSTRRTAEMVLEDRVAYEMGTDANGQAEFVTNQSRHATTTLDAERVFPKAGSLRGDQEKTVAELRESIAERRTRGLPTERQEYYIHLKFSIPAACFVFALMGLGLGVNGRRGGRLGAFALGSGVIFGYYIIMFQARSLSFGMGLPAWLAAWLPNIVLGPIGAFVLYRRARSSGRSFQLVIPAVGVPRPFLPRPSTVSGAVGARARPVLVLRSPTFWTPMPGILDRYVATMYLRVQALTFVGFLGILYISTFIDISDKLFGGQVTANMIARFYFFKTPEFVYYLVPLSVLIATLVTVGALARHSELIVMRACGISLYRVSLPLVMLAAASSVLLFGIEEYALAVSSRQAKELEEVIRFGAVRTRATLDRRWMVGRSGDIYHYDYFDERRGELHGSWRYEFDQKDWRLSRITFATSARFDPAASKPEAAVGIWTARQGWTRLLEPDGDSEYETFDDRQFAMEPPEYFGTERVQPASMPYTELRDYIDSLQGSGANTLQLLVDLHRKIAFPFVAIVMSLLAVPFAVSTGRRGTLYGIGVGIVLAIVYWTATNLFGVVGSAGLVTPALAAWAPNLIFGAGAAYLILAVRT
jgi:LPS export ABC transporter permease LptG/LPS export ABC transporter permease LptF